MAHPDPILSAVASCRSFQELALRLPAPAQRDALGGLAGSAGVAVAAALQQAHPDRVWVLLTPGPREAAAAEADLEALLGSTGMARLYPQKEALPYEEVEPNLEIGSLRVEAVEGVFSGRSKILVTTPRALQERTPIPAELAQLRLTVRRGDTVELHRLAHLLEERGFERVPMVEEVGQFALRGGILDVFSVGAGDPTRIELWGDEVASIRSFEILDQRSVAELDETHVLPVDFRRGAGAGETVPRSLLELLPGDAVLTVLGAWDPAADIARTWERVTTLYGDLVDSGASPPPPATLFLCRLYSSDAADALTRLAL
ncbi:MAG: hypothetical protein FIA95_08670, partial [Gemmatimonadetes bacterium]|nr:hypothetical protein [Gemmatimonadota bacterium]